MKNKLRALANCILILTSSLWFPILVIEFYVKDVLFEKNETLKKRNRKQFVDVFIKGKEWFWE
jgi:hypothetical protein